MQGNSKNLGEQWQSTLTTVEATVDAAIALIGEREKVLDEFIENGKTANDLHSGKSEGLENYLKNVQALRSQAAKAEAGVAEVDNSLAAEEQTLRQWLASTKAAREKLQCWLDREEAAEDKI